jgi:hypothetical protein
MAAILAEVVARLETIAALEVHYGFPGKLARVPAAVVYPPERIDFDLTYGRGTDQYPELIVVIFVRRGIPRQAIADIAPYLAGSGASSIKAKLDTTAVAGYASAADVQVLWADLDPLAAFGGSDYVAALFHLKITGSGA